MPALETYSDEELSYFFEEYIKDKSCKTPSEFFSELGIDIEELKIIRERVFTINPDLYRLFVNSWREKNIDRKNRVERKNKQRVSKILNLIENVEDLDVLEFWKLIPYDGDDNFLYNIIDYVKKNHIEKYYDFIGYLARKRILYDEGLLRINPDEIKSNSTLTGDETVSATSNKFIINYMEKHNIPMIRRAYYDVLESYIKDRDKIIRDVYGMGPVKTKKIKISN